MIKLEYFNIKENFVLLSFFIKKLKNSRKELGSIFVYETQYSYPIAKNKNKKTYICYNALIL